MTAMSDREKILALAKKCGAFQHNWYSMESRQDECELRLSPECLETFYLSAYRAGESDRESILKQMGGYVIEVTELRAKLEKALARAKELEVIIEHQPRS